MVSASVWLSLMVFPKIIFFISISIWLFTPFRQYKNRYFLYFLILAILDPLVLIIQLFGSIQPSRIYLIGVLFQIISLLNFRKTINYKIILLLIIITNIWFSFNFGILAINLCLILENLIVLTIFLKISILNTYENMQINSFYVVIIFYLISIITKFLVGITDLKFGVPYFYLTSAFEIIIGIFFIFFNDKNSPRLNWFFNKDI